jgi:hypothetical protein
MNCYTRYDARDLICLYFQVFLCLRAVHVDSDVAALQLLYSDYLKVVLRLAYCSLDSIRDLLP